MISHKHKCIFIHISKCAGSSIEHGFGIDLEDNTENNNKNLYGWNNNHEIFLQHATPQQLLDYKFISKEIWESYYKFVVVRNPFSRAKSDYIWLCKDMGIKDTFENFLNGKGEFYNVLNIKDYQTYRGDHLIPQKDYFYLNGKIINYDRVFRFENLNEDLKLLKRDLKLTKNFFSQKINTSGNKEHYSFFYDAYKIGLVTQKYCEDLKFLNYSFDNKMSLFQKIKKML